MGDRPNALYLQLKALWSRLEALEGRVTTVLKMKRGEPGPKGDKGEPGPPGPPGEPGAKAERPAK